MSSNDWLPVGYKEPATSNYMKLAPGENTFRILSRPIMGYEWWKDEKDSEGKDIRRPHRVKEDTDILIEKVDSPEQIKHFWAMVVYNVNDNKIQILEITQKTIKRGIEALARNTKWGSPINYNIVITRSGEGRDSEYQVNPEPKEELDKKIIEQCEKMDIDIEKLYTGEDPFGKKVEDEGVDIDDAVDAAIDASSK